MDLLEKKKHRPSSRTPPGLIGDGDLIGLSSGLVGRPHVQDPGVVKNMALVSKNKEHSAYLGIKHHQTWQLQILVLIKSLNVVSKEHDPGWWYTYPSEK